MSAERWGDSARDRAQLDAWITREQQLDEEDGLDLPVDNEELFENDDEEEDYYDVINGD